MTKKEECVLCMIAENRVPAKKLYEDDEIMAVLDVNGASPGHAFVFAKQHIPILEQVPDDLLKKLFDLSNKVSSSLFDTLNIQGTNIFIANGVAAGQQLAHFLIQVIPRNENDGINLQWQPRQLSEEEMSTVELQLKDATKDMLVTDKSPAKETLPQKKPASVSATKDDFRLKLARKIP
jgi:histidine triad (HIT) family protein